MNSVEEHLGSVCVLSNILEDGGLQGVGFLFYHFVGSLSVRARVRVVGFFLEGGVCG